MIRLLTPMLTKSQKSPIRNQTVLCLKKTLDGRAVLKVCTWTSFSRRHLQRNKSQNDFWFRVAGLPFCAKDSKLQTRQLSFIHTGHSRQFKDKSLLQDI